MIFGSNNVLGKSFMHFYSFVVVRLPVPFLESYRQSWINGGWSTWVKVVEYVGKNVLSGRQASRRFWELHNGTSPPYDVMGRTFTPIHVKSNISFEK